MSLKSGLVSRLLSLNLGELIFGDKAKEGIRRAVCDMSLLFFHLTLSGFTFDGVDISVASKVVKWNLKRYPNGIHIFCYPRIHFNPLLFLGVFFLLGAGRISISRSQPEQAIKYYNQAIRAQSQYRNLHHISHWEMALAHLCLWDTKSSLSCWTELEKDATVSEFITPDLCVLLTFFISGRNPFILMEWLSVCWRLEVVMMMMKKIPVM